MKEPDGLFGAMQDIAAGKPFPNVTDFSVIFIAHQARKAAEADRDLVAESFHRAVVGPADTSDGAYSRWLRGL